MAEFTIREAKKGLDIVIDKSHDKNEILDEKSSQIATKRLHELLVLLVSELSSSHPPVRQTVHELIQFVSDKTEKKITNLLEPFKQNLTNSITIKRFKQLQPTLQTGFCDAVTFFLSLDPQLLTLNQETIQIVEKAYAIYNKQKDENTSDIEIKNQFALKMACLKLLKTALNCPEMYQETVPDDINILRTKIIEILFKYLNHDYKEVVLICKSGLSTYLKNQVIQKDYLQITLRPILQNLGDFRKLNLPTLQTLAHLLELCKSYFNVNLGEQLLKHLHNWIEPKKISHLNSKSEQIAVAAGIINLFSLLPSDAKKFVSSLVTITINLEKAWSVTEFSSPFREPLTKFLNLYPMVLQYLNNRKLLIFF
jgi:hypothetical protein